MYLAMILNKFMLSEFELEVTLWCSVLSEALPGSAICGYLADMGPLPRCLRAAGVWAADNFTACGVSSFRRFRIQPCSSQLEQFIKHSYKSSLVSIRAM